MAVKVCPLHFTRSKDSEIILFPTLLLSASKKDSNQFIEVYSYNNEASIKSRIYCNSVDSTVLSDFSLQLKWNGVCLHQVV